MKRTGFTLAELVIVMAIVLMLAAAALSGGMGVLRGLRFNSTFNKIVLMTQQARSLAITGKGNDAITAYGIKLELNKLILFSETPEVIMDSFILDPSQTIHFFADNTNQGCALPAFIRFRKGNGETSFECPGTNEVNPSILQMGANEEQAGGQIREKSFRIHRSSGVLQVE